MAALQPILPLLTLVIMICCLGLIMIPAVPVSVLEWSIAVVFAALTGFERVGLVAVGIITVLMLLGATSGLWLPLFGLRGKNMSCLGVLGLFVGMILGSMAMPIIGTLMGGMLGVMVVEYGRGQSFDDAMESGQTALKTILITMAAEFIFAVSIVTTFGIALFMSG